MKKILEWVTSLVIAIGLVSLSALLTLNWTYVYHWIIDRYQIALITGLPREALIENYWELVKYLQLPWIGELYLPDFYMSESGRSHFGEVRTIFLSLYGILIVCLICWLFAVIRGKKVLPFFNRAANLSFLVFGMIGALLLLDFERTFYGFHRLFFHNNDWLFHPLYDPVILALPSELFLISGGIIIGFLFLICLFIKFLYYRYYKV